MKKPVIEAPIIRNKQSALVFSRGMWKVGYRRDGKKAFKSTGTKDLEKAIEFRDKFFADHGVTLVHKPTERYIYKISYWRVVLPGKVTIGCYTRLRQAMQARDAALKEVGVRKPRKKRAVKKKEVES